jgi:hypothetical protein
MSTTPRPSSEPTTHLPTGVAAFELPPDGVIFGKSSAMREVQLKIEKLCATNLKEETRLSDGLQNRLSLHRLDVQEIRKPFHTVFTALSSLRNTAGEDFGIIELRYWLDSRNASLGTRHTTHHLMKTNFLRVRDVTQ